MSELASRAVVSSLLGLLENEALLLSRVGSDVEFIRAEMESMHSFLEHLARTAPPDGRHNVQVRTWMKQVRELAHDCSSSIDMYLRRGDPALYRARGRRYLWWVSWLVQKLVAQHKAAIRLRELKERAYDVSQRRLRYGVEIPGKGAAATATSIPSSSQAAVAEDGDDDEQGDQNQTTVATDGFDPHRRALLEPRGPEEYCTEKLANWLELQSKTMGMPIASTAIVAPDDAEKAGAIARDSLTLAGSHFTSMVWINLPELHRRWDVRLLPWEILADILRECEIQHGQQQGDEVREPGPRPRPHWWGPYSYKQELRYKIRGMLNSEDIDEKIGDIIKKIKQVDTIKFEETKSLMMNNIIDKRLGILLHVLRPMQLEARHTGLPSSWDKAMKETAFRLQAHMEKDIMSGPQIRLDRTQYKHILEKVFTVSKTPQPQQALEGEATTSATKLSQQDHIQKIDQKQMIRLDILLALNQQLLEEGNSDTGWIQQQCGHDQVAYSATAAQVVTKETMGEMKEFSGKVRASSSSAVATTVNETVEKTIRIKELIIDQLRIRGIVDMISKHLKHKKTLIILQDDKDFVFQLEETRYALSLLGRTAGSAVILSTNNSQKAKEFCNPPGEPITCSLVGLYHDIVVQLTEQREINGNDGYNPQILRDILDRCLPHEFCMKIFAHALYANPNRSCEELIKLHEDLFPQNTFGSKADTMLKFSYNDLPRQYKTCLLYLAIFPRDHNIRRSTLIARWVAEGLITNEDWYIAVRQAERCFDALFKRGLVLPRDIGVAGKVKSCVVGDQVHVFITKIAKKEQILDARLSDIWSRHFSIFSGLRLRASDDINKFVHNLIEYSSQLLLLKVLDLEGSGYHHKNRYLKDICNRMLLLKYLSLRGTNVTQLPSEINNLTELEVLDIRQTKVPECATRDVLLLKLRRLLADRIGPSSRMN